ncbi:hypothetical protein MMH89_00345 [Candidatus Comchoanobacter bicostacola]|uniref:Ribulose-phosphate 3-epimerase n=1 Tax=Candidatus Comchoanobacter bicostacola TaxID=2919598 RepID=A0ABY5DJ84_9GAMM|nr:hypothetical protein [Candidatus Comchoanobacter bicostacola]UTC24615.1 hypothetical protein MMH89_00345 [Candidatus Comchoanobacter bicostacola]
MNFILPSLLAAPSLNLADCITQLMQLGLKDLHIDCMDFQYTHNFGLNIQNMKDIRSRYPECTLDVHLMTKPTSKALLNQLIEIGIKNISVHWNTLDTATQQWLIKQPIDLRIALSPDESIPSNCPTQRLLILCVNPGFSHQALQVSMLEKAKQAKQQGFDVMLDGGINLDNIEKVLKVNPDHIVMGGGLLKHSPEQQKSILSKIKDLRG